MAADAMEAPMAAKTDPIIEAMAKDAQAAIRKAAEEAERAKVYQLAFWPDTERAMPGDFIACALFCVARRTEYVTRDHLASINGLTVIFTGKRMNQVHADVWMGIMHLARERSQGDVVRFHLRDLLGLIGRHNHQSQRKQIVNAISQLKATDVLIQDDEKRERFGGSLLPKHEEKDDADGPAIFKVFISPELARLLSGRFWRIDWALRKRLQNKPLALWLQTYFTRFEKPVSVQQLHALSGSGASTKTFRQKLGYALVDLHKAGGPLAILDRETDTVRLHRRSPRTRHPANGDQAVLPFARKP
jgi:hypothetical protein